MVASFLRLLRKVIIRTPADDRCVLVFATTAIGDSIMMSSCIRLLGEAGFNIYLVAGKAAVTVLGDHEAIKKNFPLSTRVVSCASYGLADLES